MSSEIGAEYASSLADLTVNSKPLINMLTILAEENQDHAGVIVNAVEQHLEKVRPEIKLPVLYLVDSIIKNVGGEYTQKFSQIIVNMFTKTFKQVDEKTRSNMFKLRETWNDVFPPNRLYQLDVKVSLIDPAWPIQAQVQVTKPAPAAPVIHVNPRFQKKVTALPTMAAKPESQEDIMSVLARKQQELRVLQRQKMELEVASRKQLEQKTEVQAVVPPVPSALVHPPELPTKVPVQQRLGPQLPPRAVPSAGARIAPVSGAMLATARRADPRLARQARPAPDTVAPPQPPPPPPAPAVVPDLFSVKPVERQQRVFKRKNAITIDVSPNKEETRRDSRDPRRRDPRLKKRPRDIERRDNEKRMEQENKPKRSTSKDTTGASKDEGVSSSKPLDFPVVDAKQINKLPPIPKINRNKPVSPPQEAESPKKKEPESPRVRKQRKKDKDSPEKPVKNGPKEKRPRGNKVDIAEPMELEVDSPRVSEPVEENEPVTFKELRGSTRERNYMRRNREKSESPVPSEAVLPEPSTVPDVLMDENKDVDLRVLTNPSVEPAAIGRKRPSTDSDTKPSKKNKLEKFDILFGDEDVDLRKLPQMEEAPAPPVISKEPEPDTTESPASPDASPDRGTNKTWAKVKDKKSPEDARSQLDLVRAKLAEATKGKDRLGRPLRFSKDELKKNSDTDTDMRYTVSENESENGKESIKIIMSQAEEQLKGGNLNPEQFNHLVMQVMQLNERQKLKEAKQRESLEASKRKLQKLSAQTDDDEPETKARDKTPPKEIEIVTPFGDIDERILPVRLPQNELPALSNADSDLRVPPISSIPSHLDAPFCPFPPPSRPLLQIPAPFQTNFLPRNGPPPLEEFPPRRRGRMPGPGPFFRGRMPFDRLPRPLGPRMPPPPVPGMCQGPSPLKPYIRSISPPRIGTTDLEIPPTDMDLVEYIERDPMKTIDIDGVPREIRFYGRTAIAMLDWDDPRAITFLPGRRIITIDGKDTFSLDINDEDVKVNVDGRLINIGIGKPTRELYIEGKWYECYFGGPPIGVIVDNTIMVVHMSGPPPQVDIGKDKMTDYVAGKINLIIDAIYMCPLFLDAKPQKVEFNGTILTVRFVDAFQTVMINEKPFKVEYGDLPKPIIVNRTKHFIRFSVLPRNIRPGQISIRNMEGIQPTTHIPYVPTGVKEDNVEYRNNEDAENSNPGGGGLDMLSSQFQPSKMASASQFSGYSVAEPLKPTNPGQIPGLDTPQEENPPPVANVPFFGNINVNDLFAKLVATGIVPQSKPEKKEVEEREKPAYKNNSKKIMKVDLLKPETLRVKQMGVVSLLYSGMQCSGCGARFPPEQTVRYSQHLDWHFRQNRRERDSARRAHSRAWNYDLADWIQYEEVEDLDEREKSWFDSQGPNSEEAEMAAQTGEHEALSVAAGAPADAACALCGDKFDQFYNEDKEEWHLRKAVRHDEKNYHPLCFEDYKASLTKMETIDDSVVEVEPPKLSPAMDGAANDVEEVVESDDESVVEVLDNDLEEVSQEAEQSVIELEPTQSPDEDEDDDDDVVLAQEPPEQVDVEDADTDDETTAERARRDETYHANIRIKQEPVDPDDEPIVTAEVEAEPPMITRVDTTHTEVTSSIDGNVQLETSAPILPTGGIRINITKPIATIISPRREEVVEEEEEPLPPGEEPEIEYKLKPSLQNVVFSRQPPIEKGIELSGLCSIM